jgi:hypothetical protein
LLLVLVLGYSAVSVAQEAEGLHLVKRVSVPGVQRKWDHFGVDLPGNQLLVLPIFINHHWTEPGETIKDQLLVNIPNSETFALKLELRIVGTNTIARNIESNAVYVIFLDEQLQSTMSFDSTSERSNIVSSPQIA